MLVLQMLAQGATANSIKREKIVPEKLPSLNIPRAGHSTLFVNGEPTVIGGHTNGFVPTATAEYYSEGKWHLLNTVYAHDDGYAITMTDGKVLIFGGHEKHLGIGQTFVVEKYDPETHSFEGFGCLDTKRSLASAALLSDGRVVITGNHYYKDNIEIFDGKSRFSYVKEVAQGRCTPFIFRMSGDDLMFVSNFDTLCNIIERPIVDRLKGEPFKPELFKEWGPISTDRVINNEASFIGDASKGDFSYLMPVRSKNGEVAIALVRDTVFTLLPNHTIPIKAENGEKIEYCPSLLFDRTAQRAYLVGYDMSRRIYVYSFKLINHKITDEVLYYTDSLPDMGSSVPLLTPGGNIMIIGGYTDSNFYPKNAVYLLRFGNKDELAESGYMQVLMWLIPLFALLSIITGIIVFTNRRRRKNLTNHQEEITDKEIGEEEKSDEVYEHLKETDYELLSNIRMLMEEQELFLNSELKVSDIAAKLNTNSTYVSDCIRSACSCSFSQFVNGYRIERAKQLMQKYPDKKISTLCIESGFSNDTSFFRTFKASMGKTPREWMAEVSTKKN